MKWICTIAFMALMTSAGFAVDHTKDSLSTIKKNVESKKAVLIDVREKSEWDAGHINGAIFLPLSSLRDGVSAAEQKQLPKDKIIYLHCAVGYRAKVAADILEKYNKKLRPIKGGYEDLLDAGFQKGK